MWSFLINHLDYHTERLRNHKNIAKDDCGIDEARETLDWLESKGGSDFGGATACEEVIVTFRLVVFWQVSSS